MSRARRRTAKGLIILASVFAFLSVFGIWVERQALNTDDWVDTSGRLIENDKIRTAVADYIVDELYENVDIKKELEDIFPGETKDLAGPAAGALRQVAGDGAEEVLKTSTAQSLWRDANRTAHEQLMAVIEDKKDAVSTENGEVSLNLGSLVTNLANQVGIGASLAEKLPADAGQIKILESDELKTAQNIVVAIKGLALVLSILTFACFALAIYLYKESRWIAVLFAGVGLIAAGFAVIVARQIAGGIVIDQLVTDETVKPAAEAAWSIATSLMVSIATTVIVVGVLFAVAGWLASPHATSRATRKVIAPALRDYSPWVYTGLAIIVSIYFLSSSVQSLRSFVTTLIVALMAAAWIHELRKQCIEEFPDAKFSDTFGGPRDRVVSAVKGANLGERAAKLGESAKKVRLPEVPRSDGGETPTSEAPTTEAPTAVLGEDQRLARLERLGELREKGILSDEEFAAEKARVLGD
ncbi:MAG TPA: SHOCT domain-containing protein [Solirubrobacterales bacterium]|nr:SHOCT domain-containing protein [Solirubrobacterales bacterium]